MPRCRSAFVKPPRWPCGGGQVVEGVGADDAAVRVPQDNDLFAVVDERGRCGSDERYVVLVGGPSLLQFGRRGQVQV